ncbi:MAG: zinc dependent phospholipase C family protein [Anaerolineales bacterium]|nr:zinc dependent phospholipase C family protein [Anaerolineales bacterium]
MPTPFYHLSIAEEILSSPELDPALGRFLHSQRAAFFLGKTAPDVQSLSGQPRPETHFYRLPLRSLVVPWEKMFSRFPQIADPARLAPDHAAFISGYICHLQADIIWITDLFVPYFLPQITKYYRKRVGYLHNVLRAYLDEKILPALRVDIGNCLSSVDPTGWLPFVEDHWMIEWRQFLSAQLMPAAEIKTVEVFAARSDVPVDEFIALLHDEARMEEQVFSFVPREVLIEYRDNLVSANLKLLAGFLAGVPAQGG